jgi:hypothetical protein
MPLIKIFVINKKILLKIFIYNDLNNFYNILGIAWIISYCFLVI